MNLGHDVANISTRITADASSVIGSIEVGAAVLTDALGAAALDSADYAARAGANLLNGAGAIAQDVYAYASTHKRFLAHMAVDAGIAGFLVLNPEFAFLAPLTGIGLGLNISIDAGADLNSASGQQYARFFAHDVPLDGLQSLIGLYGGGAGLVGGGAIGRAVAALGGAQALGVDFGLEHGA